MRIGPEQLVSHLKKSLLPVYLIEGDELFLRQEALDLLRVAAKKAGFTERQRFEVESGLDWGTVVAAFASPSLFSPRQLTEIHWHDSKLDKNAVRALNAMTQHLSDDSVLLLSTPHLGREVQREPWYQAIDQQGAITTCWPLHREAFSTWLTKRLQSRGYAPQEAALHFLAERVEGNLFAAAREIDALRLRLPPEGKTPRPLTVDDLLEAVGDSTRFTVYDLTQAALEGDAAAVTRIVAGLQAEGVEIVLASWAVSREIQLLLRLRFVMQRGTPFDQACRQLYLLERRKPLIQKALKRLKTPQLVQLLELAAHLDEAAKGLHADPWVELLHLALLLCGRPLLSSSPFLPPRTPVL